MYTQSVNSRLCAHFFAPVLAGMLMLPYGAKADKLGAKSSQGAAYAVIVSRRDSADDFNAFLNRCSLEERVCLMQSLMGLKDQKLAKQHFGKLVELKNWDDYVEKTKKATQGKPLRPKTFNDVSPSTVVDAIDRAILPESCVSSAAIRKELLWNCCSKLRYHILKKRKVHYHKEALQWVCHEHGMPNTVVESLSTYDLERKFVERNFEEIWNKLDQKQREELLVKIESANKTTIANKTGIAAMTGGAAVAALGTTVVFSGFAFYTTMTTAMSTVAGWAGVSFSTYASATTTVSVFAGPVGWCVAGASLFGGAVLASWPDSQKTANFVITAHLIKTRWANPQ